MEAPDLACLIQEIASHEGGTDVAAQILHMRFYNDHCLKNPIADELRAVGRILLMNAEIVQDHTALEHVWADLAQVCLGGSEGTTVALSIVTKLATRLRRTGWLASGQELLDAVIKVQPAASLDILVDGSDDSSAFLKHSWRPGQKLLAAADPEAIVAWCRGAPDKRFPKVALLVPLASRENLKAPLTWSPSAKAIINATPDLPRTLQILVNRIASPFGNRSRATYIREHLALLDELTPAQKIEAAEVLAKAKQMFEAEAAREDSRGQDDWDDRNQGFE